LIIELLNGTRLDVADYNLKRLYHYIPSANIEHNSVAIDGRSDIILNSKINNRTISVDFVYLSQDIFDFYLLRDEVNSLFLREESYYIIFKNEPHKRWLVKAANGYNLQPNQRLESFTIEFIALNLYAESVATTQSLKEWDIDVWAWNGSINWDEDLQYTFNSNNFTVKNLGNAIINPRQSPLRIIVVGTFDDTVNIRNTTTGDFYSFTHGVNINNGNRLVLDGIRTVFDEISFFRRTNKKLITLAPGDNVFEVTGGQVESISFDFRFLYK